MSKPQDGLIFVAGHNGMVGRALVRRLKAAGYHARLAALARRSGTSPT